MRVEEGKKGGGEMVMERNMTGDGEHTIQYRDGRI